MAKWMIQIRTTELEKFINCPFKFKFDPPRDGSGLYFAFGTTLWKLVVMNIICPDNIEGKDLLLRRRWVKFREQLITMSNIVLQKIKDEELTYVLDERSEDKLFEDINIMLGWTFDLLFKDKEWNYIMIDLKTAAQPWDDAHIEWVRQCRIYPYLHFVNNQRKIKRFEYRILSKTSIPKLQVAGFDIPDDQFVDYVDEEIHNYAKAIETDVWMPKYKNYQCHRCKLYDKCSKYVAL